MEKIISIIILILYGVVMLLMCYIAIFQKEKKLKNNVQSKNNVHFYVARDKKGILWLYLGKPVRRSEYFICDNKSRTIGRDYCFEDLGLKTEDYKNLKWEDEPVEVFLNLKN